MSAATGKRLVLPSSPNLGGSFAEFRFKRRATTEESVAGCEGAENIDWRTIVVDRTDPETTAIEALVQDYFLGMYEGDVERLQRVFHPQCWLFGESRGGCHEFPVSGFLDQFANQPAPKAEGEPFDMRLVSIDRTGSVAVVKDEVLYQGRQYTDYLMLQKTEAGWSIVNKAFFSPG